MRRSMKWARARAAPAISPAPPTIMSSSRPSSPTSTARRRRCSSPPPISPTIRPFPRLQRLMPGLVIFSDEKNHASMIEGIRRGGGEKHIFRHNDVEHLEELLKKVPAVDAEDHRVRERLFDGRPYRADRGDLRPRREIRRADLSRRGACRRPLRPARRRHRRARRRDGTASTSSTARWPRASA